MNENGNAGLSRAQEEANASTFTILVSMFSNAFLALFIAILVLAVHALW